MEILQQTIKEMGNITILFVTASLISLGILNAQHIINLFPHLSNAHANKMTTYDGQPPHMEYFPSLTINSTKTSIVICPGGGYRKLAFAKEGTDLAHFFTEKGIDVYVLSYRLNSKFPVPYSDANTALNIINNRASYDRIGVMGFSAGGHLASIVSTLNSKPSTSATSQKHIIPSFCILIYPVISMANQYTHIGSRDILIGPSPDISIIEQLSANKQVTADTPPTVIIHAMDDTVVPVTGAFLHLQALQQAKVQSSAVFFDHGGHGFGMGLNRKTNELDRSLHTWVAHVLDFILIQTVVHKKGL
jgi:acetyl esterase/lipase